MIPVVVTGIEYQISNFASLPIKADTATLFDPASGWFSDAGIFLLNAFTYHLIGWLIGVGYYRFGWVIGFGFIGIAIFALSLNDYFWGDNGLSSIIPWVPNIPADANPALAIAGSLLLIAVLLASMRMLTKRISIKM
ncbi:hypothetical protein [Planococcus antarcticus]|uniref:hypothetical protein n=1 Tax=Planococcus antarcticus TaxID=161360 RepID=UPI001EE684D8|nr:hypothetical protein [Planococcus antarcticus]